MLHTEIIPQFRNQQNRYFNSKNFAEGMYLFALGLFKKVIIADTFGTAVTYGFGTIETLSSIEALIVSFSYTFQLYFDFSGYCDMAMGIGYMFNIKLPQNFNSPYKAKSITEFWERWHMSLTRFLRTYIYIPLGGNRKGKIRTYINIMTVFLVSGIWHGANWTFILWGLLHGILNCLNRLCKKSWERLGKVIQWFITFMLVNILWIIFRADNIASAILFIKRMCCFSNLSIGDSLYNCFDLEELTFIEEKIPFLNYLSSQIMGFHLWLFIFGAFFIVVNCRNSKELEFRPTIATAFITVVFMFWSVISLEGIFSFLYYNF